MALRTVALNIAAGNNQVISNVGDMVHVMSANARLVIETDHGDYVVRDAGQQARFTQSYASLYVRGENDAAVVAEIVIGTGESLDSLVSGSIDVNPADTFSHDQVAVGVAAVLVAAANADRKKGITVRAAPGNSGIVYVGNAGVTVADGFPLAAGDAFTFENAAAVYAIADAAAQSVAFVEE